MIVDTHIHYSEPPTADRPYATDFHSGLDSHSIDEILATVATGDVDRIVQVVQTKMGYDNRYGLEGVAQHPERIIGVIGRFDPLQPDLENKLAAFKAEPRFLGVRHTLMTPQNSSWLKERKLDPFLTAAQKLDVAVQLYVANQIEEQRQTVKRFPGVRFLIDHMGLAHSPPRSFEATFGDWNAVIALAAEPNVWMKVSYFPEAAHNSEKYPYPRAQQMFKEMYERAGPKRLVWGSNYPPVGQVCSYREAVDFMRVHCAFLAPADREAIMGGNFMRDFVKKGAR